MTCSFCRSHRVKWRYPSDTQTWLACEPCHEAIARDDREALLERVLFGPVPRTLPERYESRFRERARELHERFWQLRSGPASPA